VGAGGPVLVDVHGVEKSYSGFQALKGVDFELRSGEVHAVLGQNGAGKSTFIKVLAGVEQPSAGTIEVLGEQRNFQSAHDSREAGIAVVYQDLSLVPSMTVVDNLFLGRELHKGPGVVDRRKMLAKAREFLAEYDFDLNPKAMVANLPFAYRQMTEIAKALMGKVRVLILDEPTSALSEHEEEVLFSAVRKVVDRGVGVIHVTHRLHEVFTYCDRVTVFRDGSKVDTRPVEQVDLASLVAMIVGQDDALAEEIIALEQADDAALQPIEKLTDLQQLREPLQPVLQLDGVANEALSDVSLSIGPGEVVGLAGVIGSGRTEILETVFGLRGVSTGHMILNGSPKTIRSPVDAIRAGIGLVPEDRHEQGLVLDHAIDRNLSLPVLGRLSRRGAFRRRSSLRRSRDIMDRLSVKAPNPLATLTSLSGGNQQKVVFGKWLDPRCQVLLLDEPTVGVDVGAREEIYDAIRRATGEGTAVLMVSSDFDELLLLCDRVYVVRHRSITQSVSRSDIASSEHLHRLVAGNYQSRRGPAS
jgi:ribose transport system ATP-binding protein